MILHRLKEEETDFKHFCCCRIQNFYHKSFRLSGVYESFVDLVSTRSIFVNSFIKLEIDFFSMLSSEFADIVFQLSSVQDFFTDFFLILKFVHTQI